MIPGLSQNHDAHHRRNLGSNPFDSFSDDSRETSSPNSPGFLKQGSRSRSIEYKQKIDEGSDRNQLIYKNSFWTQTKALLAKNVALQAKQKGTNICQILLPICCLIITLVFKMLAKQELNKVYTFNIEMPYFFNIPYAKIYNQSVNLANQTVLLSMSTCLEWYLYDFKNASQETKSYITQKDSVSQSSFLDNVLPLPDKAKDYYMCPEYKKVTPYFEKASNGTINEQIYWALQYINTLPFDDDVDTPGTEVIPDGAITFYNASHNRLDFKIQINDVRLPEYHRGNGVTKIYLYDPVNKTMKNTLRVSDGQLILLDLMTRAYLQKHNPKVSLVSGSQYMPLTTSEETILLKIMSMLGATLYPIALSIILPVFLYGLVLEKEERLREMMKMNGMKMRNYWIVNYFWNITLFMLSASSFVFFGYFVLRLPFFRETNPFILFSVIFGWGLNQVSLSFFFQNFLTKVRTATIAGYLLSIWTCIIAVCFSIGIYPYPTPLPTHMKLYPPFAFCRLIYRLSITCSNFVCARDFNDFDTEMKDCMWVLYAGAVIFLILGLYLDKVWPQEYGVKRSPFFFLTCCCRRSDKSEKREQDGYKEIQDESHRDHNLILEMTKEDEDVQVERETVSKLLQPLHEYPLVIKNLRKVYKAIGGRPKKTAVKDISLHIKKGEMFGLLGPNGAGKTSLISMLTGLYQPEGGNAWVGGYDIVNQIDIVHSKMGVCPQFDLLWPELSVEEHLYFYARIRGVPKEEEKNVVMNAMQDVRLTKFAKFETKQLSGGMKRRLSVALAFVGNPQIVLLDEPTTGLDPENRRSLWDILMEQRKDRAMVLTTHSMEEADILCTRIGIIVGGSLKCIGPQTRLKSKYGGGYQLVIHCHKDKYLKTYSNSNGKQNADYYHAKVLDYVQNEFPNAVLKSQFHGSFLFQIPMDGLEVSKVFDELEARKEEFAISDWGVSQCTLEDVFMEIVKYVEENNES